MALYRCAACGSPNVVTDTQQQGYNYVKGAIGTAILGVGGAAAGINGKTKKVYKCPDCGLTLNEPMSFEIKTLIDFGVMSPAARKNLKLGDVPIDWEVFTAKYRNIEKDPVSAQIPTAESGIGEASPVAPPPPQPPIAADEKDRNRRVYKVARNHYIKECLEWFEQCDAVRATRNALKKEALHKEKEKLTQQITQTRDTFVTTKTNFKERMTKELEATEKLLASLGVFQFGAKNDARDKIEMLNRVIAEAENDIRRANSKYKIDMQNVGDQADKAQAAIQAEINKKHPMPRKPKKPFVLSRFTKSGEEAAPVDVGKAALQDAVFEYIEEHGSVTYTQIKKGCTVVDGLPDSWIQSLITALVSEHSIINSSGKYAVNYWENPDWELRLLSEEDILTYEAYQREEAEKKEKANQEANQEKNKLRDQILNIMKGKGPVTVEDIREYAPEFDTPKTPMIMNELAEEGILIRTEKRYRSYFEYK